MSMESVSCSDHRIVSLVSLLTEEMGLKVEGGEGRLDIINGAGGKRSYFYQADGVLRDIVWMKEKIGQDFYRGLVMGEAIHEREGILLSPSNDGITHINIFSNANSPLGRMMSNFYHLPLELGKHGWFDNLEGYWQWLLCHPSCPNRNKLRTATGHVAKRSSLTMPYNHNYDADRFQRMIRRAVFIKAHHPEISSFLAESTLPFLHYYVKQNNQCIPAGHEWFIRCWEDARREIQEKGN